MYTDAYVCLPMHMAAGARDLIPRMLLVDPLKRITIPEIRQHYWFNLHLPRYLAVMQVGLVLHGRMHVHVHSHGICMQVCGGGGGGGRGWR